jgi:hypothetical protein
MELEVTALYEKNSLKFFNLRFIERIVILLIAMAEAVSLFFIQDSRLFSIILFWCIFTLIALRAWATPAE